MHRIQCIEYSNSYRSCFYCLGYLNFDSVFNQVWCSKGQVGLIHFSHYHPWLGLIRTVKHRRWLKLLRKTNNPNANKRGNVPTELVLQLRADRDLSYGWRKSGSITSNWRLLYDKEGEGTGTI